MYSLKYGEKWDTYFEKLDGAIQKVILKKIKNLKKKTNARHLRYGLPYFVLETGQYRICFKTDEEKEERTIYFAGTHKQYLRWIREQQSLR